MQPSKPSPGSLWVTPFALALGAASLFAPRAASAQIGLSDQRPPPKAYVLTMGPGDHPFARFGHNALLLDFGARQVVYNWGTFAFDGLNGVKDFMAGRFNYWLSVASLERTLGFYEASNRTVVAQELDLTPSERRKLAALATENARPENREYDYDYYKDNCTTRVRDIVDRALDGKLSRGIEGTGRYTYREHTERLSAEEPWLYFGLDLALGPLTDVATSRYDELWVPGELESGLAAAKVERDGKLVPLVSETRTLVSADRPGPRSEPPSRVAWFGSMGAAFGGGMFFLGDRARTSRVARAAFGAITALFSGFFGLIGCVLAVFWAFTKHWSAYRNENILVCGPWGLLLAVTAVGLALGHKRLGERTQQLLAVSSVAALVALLLALIPGFGQDNTRIAALFAPIWFGLYAGACRITGRPLLPSRSERSRAASSAESQPSSSS